MHRFDQFDLIITNILATHSKCHPNKPALICADKQLTWGELGRRINKVGNRLVELGLKKGDKVSLLMANRIEVPEIIFGVVKAGGIIVPLSTMLPGDMSAKMVINSESKFLFVGAELRDVIGPYRCEFKNIPIDGYFLVGEQSPEWNSYSNLLQESSGEEPNVKLSYEDGFNIMYTSGTTGVPKGIFHTHHNRLCFCLTAIDFRIDSSSVSVATTALYTNGTWVMLLPTLFVGGTVVIMPKFDSRAFLELVQKQKATHALMVPTQFIGLLQLPELKQYDLSSMRIWIFGAAPLQKEVKEEIHKRFSGEAIELYGCTEGVGTMLKPEDSEGKIGSVGFPFLGGDVRIIDDQGKELARGEIGEIVGFCGFLMPEYYKLANKMEETIWRDERGRTHFKTGDLGKFDEDGFLYVVGRKKDMIISGGINIYPSDIEDLVISHPEVKEVAVVGIPDPKWGEVPLAMVIREKGSSISEEQIKVWANSKLGKYQRVSGVSFCDEFPRNALGKVLKEELRKAYLK